MILSTVGVLLGIESSATVRADKAVAVRIVKDGIKFLERTPLVALHVATLACARLDATSALLVELKKESPGKASDSFFSRLMNALMEPAPKRGAIRAHE